MSNPSQNPKKKKSMTWLLFALLTVASWGVYGILLHKGVVGMEDPQNGRYKAFLWVGIAYFITAVVAPVLMLISSGGSWKMTLGGSAYSFIAGVVGAIGAFGVLLAFAAKGRPEIVMSIIFAGAPIVNAFVAMWLHPPAGGWGAIPVPFWIGIGLAAIGGCIVTLFKPGPPAKKAPEESAMVQPAAAGGATVAKLDPAAYDVGRRD